MDDTELIMGAIKSLEKLTETQFKATDQKQDMVISEVKRHGDEIGQLYNFDRDRAHEISELGKATQPSVAHAKNATKINAAFVVGFVGVVAVACGERLVEFFKGNGGVK